uniref:Putative secreted protein n=1 Tax=Panstrongylus lignarius TaxID=156445 RepID=A0A224Y549_9HEMI
MTLTVCLLYCVLFLRGQWRAGLGHFLKSNTNNNPHSSFQEQPTRQVQKKVETGISSGQVNEARRIRIK